MDSAASLNQRPSSIRQALRFALHLVAVYAITKAVALWLAGFVYARLLPAIQQHPPSGSAFQFAFTHLFAFSFFPAAVFAFLFAQWHRHRVACFVWIVPVAILAYKLLVFQSSHSVLSPNHDPFAEALHHYFSGNFSISEYHSYRELFHMLAANPDMTRGMDQHNYTAPVYAAMGYGIGTLLGMKVQSPKLRSALSSMKPSMPSVRAITKSGGSTDDLRLR